MGHIPNTSHALQHETVKAIGQFTDNSRRFSIADIVDMLPDDLKKKWTNSNLKGRIGTILSVLVNKGYLVRVEGFKGSEKLSDVSITQKGRSFVLGFLWPLLAAVEERPLTEKQRERIELTRNNLDSFSRTSADLYYPYSNSAKIRAHLEHRMQTVDFLIGSKTPLTAKELAAKVGVSESAIYDYLAPQIRGSGEVIIKVGERVITIGIDNNKGVNYYSVKKIEPSDDHEL